MTEYSVGTRCFCDYHFSGKPDGICVEVVREGDGRGVEKGLIRVKITKDHRAYRKGEIVELPAWQAVPHKQEFTREYFRRVRTDYRWVRK